MSEKAPENIKEKVEKMSNRELGYKLAEWLMQGYHTGGHSADRSLRSSIIRLFFDLNEDVNKNDISINDNYELILETANCRDKTVEQTDSFLLNDSIDINNKKLISIILLSKLVKHYADRVKKNIELEKRRDQGENISLNDIDYSFNREISIAKLIYDLYLSDMGMTDKDISGLSDIYDYDVLRNKVDYEAHTLK